MLESIKENLVRDIDSKDLRVIVIRANGPVFSSGHDLKELVGWFFLSTVYYRILPYII